MKTYLVAMFSLFLGVSRLATAVGETKHFPAYGWTGWLHFDYPAKFKMDPKSLEGEYKGWAEFKDPDSDLAIEVSNFGTIHELDLLLTVPGVTSENLNAKLEQDNRPIEVQIAADAKHKNIGEYFRAEILPKGSEASKFPGYERFIAKKKDCVEVYFLNPEVNDQTFGRCYQQLTFRFAEGNVVKHWSVIEAVIATARPGPVYSPADDTEGTASSPSPGREK